MTADGGGGGPRVRSLTPIPFGLAFGGRERVATRTLEALRALGVDAQPLDYWDPHPGIDLLHVFGAESGMWEPASLARKLGIPVVVSAILSLGPGMRQQRIWSPVDRWLPMRTSFRYRRDLLRLADHVIAATRTEQRAIARVFGVPLDRIRVIPNGIDDVYFDADPGAFRALSGLGQYVLSVGVINRLKGQREVLKGARSVGLPSVFVGRARDPGDPYVAAFRREVAAADDVRWYESLEDALLASAFAGADVFALPSRSEGLPLAALEAQAGGARLVLSDLPQHREVFGAGATYCRYGDVGGVTAALRSALANDRPTVITPIAWSWRSVAVAMQAAYRDAMAGMAPGRAGDT